MFRKENAVRAGGIRIGLTGLLAVCLLAGVAAPAKAATLSYTGTLSVQIGGFPYGAGLFGASGVGGAVDQAVTYRGHLSTLVIPGGAFGPISASLPVTSMPTIQSVRFTGLGNLSAQITGISGDPPLGSGVMGLQGVAKICLFYQSCVFHLGIPFTPVAGVGFGLGGTRTYFWGSDIYTVQHAPWTIGQPTMTIHSPGSAVTTPNVPGGFAHGPASLTSSTALPSGAIQLVTASKVYISLIGAFPELPVVGVLSLHVVPEPGTLLLLGSGVVGLAALGRRRRRSQGRSD